MFAHRSQDHRSQDRGRRGSAAWPTAVAASVTVMVVLAALLGGCGGTGHGGRSSQGNGTNQGNGSGPGGQGAGRDGAGVGADFDVRAENAKPGGDCGLARLGYNHAVEGWLDHTSIRSGDELRLFASTTAATVTATVFRIGWYGGRTCRLVTEVGPLPGRVQAPASRDPSTNTVSTAWEPTTTFATNSWPPGAYLIRLDNSEGFQTYVPLTVRSPTMSGRVVLLAAVTTWQAYNAWGGYSLYHGPKGFADRARAVSFDRPYDYGDGAADFTGNEAPVIILAEKLGLPVAYATDIDLHADPALLDGARAVVSMGHDEYYSPAMRDALTRARDRGVNLAFLGANAVFRRIRLGPTRVGPDRLETGYKIAAEDPLNGVDNAAVTANWPSPPDASPESSLTGGMYQCNPVHADLVVRDPGHWLLAGAAVTAGSRIPGMIGSEYDRVDRAYPTPPRIEVLAHSPVVCHGRPDHSDVSYYTADSGAGVFDAGTSAWVCAVTDVCGSGAAGPVVRDFVTTVTTTMLTTFAQGPAGHQHPGAQSVPDDDAGGGGNPGSER
ncbi:N,N-dimethylformamidase beta subunit family domain-containing protein [Frankia sp. CIT1]|uniref:N,N-dimethylformamidase beta subunit family domain-containing protein n=1 Tax=Frankia sp. CIT1 TaxID=2880974 RepID=UPI001EF6C281|nr:N,N-dimethylformamidase beta subunit family domain-containing protein [Frankia sp. CIT1]